MTYEEMKSEIEEIMEGVVKSNTDDDYRRVADRMQALYKNNDVPEDLRKMFRDSDLGVVFRRSTGKGIMVY